MEIPPWGLIVYASTAKRMEFNEVKGQLAKLLATENLLIEHKNCSTASFNVSTRVLTLPIWDTTDQVYTMLVGHEVGHALYTPDDDSLDNLPCPKSYVNVTEDARIEKLMKRKFPGLSKDFYAGYRHLNDEDFFSVEDTDLNTLKLVDKINLYYKVGAYLLLPFDAAETALRDAVGIAETFSDAIDAAVAIFNYQKDIQEQNKIPAMTSPTGSTGDTPMDKTEGESEEEVSQPGDADSEGDDQSDLDTPSYSDSGGESDSDLESDTDTALQENLKDITRKYGSPKYVDILDTDLDYHVVSTEKVMHQIEEYWNRPIFTDPKEEMYRGLDWSFVDSEFSKFKRECSREVNYLAKEFEMKKAATAYSRQSTSRTGVLDTRKLHTYKFNEDLFRKVTSTVDGKNHGMIFLLDWSGSMATTIHDTYSQLLSLCYFCRKSDIPFDVYSFVCDAALMPEGYDREKFYAKGKPESIAIPEHFFLMNLLSSKLNNSTFDLMAKYLWRVTYNYHIYYGQASRNKENHWELVSKTPRELPPVLGLSGTPLNEAIVTLQSIIPNFQKQCGAEKVHVTILTDGEAQASSKWVVVNHRGEDVHLRSSLGFLGDGTIIRDRKKGYTYAPSYGYLTEQLLRYMKGRFPQCNFLGFRVCTPREFSTKLNSSGVKSPLREKALREFSKNKSACVNMGGFQELYFLSASHINMDAEFDVAEDATKSQIRSAFKKSLKSKAGNKKILSSFIGQIA